MPRILFDGWSKQDYDKMLNNIEEINSIAQVFISACKNMKFDGLVFEIWSQVGGQFNSNLLINFIQIICNLNCGFVKYIIELIEIFVAISLSKENLDSILVIPPKRSENDNLFSNQHFDALFDYLTAFSLMTYDFSSLQRPGLL